MGAGVEGGALEKLLSTDKGYPKIPRYDKQSERTNPMETWHSVWELKFSLLGLSSNEYCKYACAFSVSVSLTHTHALTHTQDHVNTKARILYFASYA